MHCARTVLTPSAATLRIASVRKQRQARCCEIAGHRPSFTRRRSGGGHPGRTPAGARRVTDNDEDHGDQTQHSHPKKHVEEVHGSFLSIDAELWPRCGTCHGTESVVWPSDTPCMEAVTSVSTTRIAPGEFRQSKHHWPSAHPAVCNPPRLMAATGAPAARTTARSTCTEEQPWRIDQRVNRMKTTLEGCGPVFGSRRELALPSHRRIARDNSITGNRPTSTIAREGRAASPSRSSRASW